ncbi:MAG: hypothetical protein WAW53_01375 [Candidatus Dormiibacterota bacterium]
MTSRAVTAGLGAVYVAASVVAPLILKTTPSDLDLYFWPSAQTVVSGHPLLIYTAHLHDVYTNDNGPLGLVPLIPVAALANALGWAGNLAGRAALAGGVVSLVVLLLAHQTVRLIETARGGVRWPLLVACTVLLAPALWIAVLDYGHVEQPLELCLTLLAIRCFLSSSNALTGIALGAAVLTRTIAGFGALPFLLVPLAIGRLRTSMTIALAAVVTIAVVMAPFLLADAQSVIHSLITARTTLPIDGGSFWIVVRDASWAGIIRSGDVYIGAAVAIALVAVALRRNPTVARTHAGIAGLLTVASCCLPLFAKSVFPYYLLEPYLFAVLWWLGRPGNAFNWRAVIPLLLTVDVFIVKAAASSAPNPWGVVASLASSSVIGLAIGLVMLDMLRAPVPAMHAPIPILDRHLHGVTSVQDAPR